MGRAKASVGVGRTVGVGDSVGVGDDAGGRVDVEVGVGGTRVSVTVGSGVCVGSTVGVTSVAVGSGGCVGRLTTANETKGVALSGVDGGATTGLTWQAVTRTMMDRMFVTLTSHAR
jgi:hypothetical protein